MRVTQWLTVSEREGAIRRAALAAKIEVDGSEGEDEGEGERRSFGMVDVGVEVEVEAGIAGSRIRPEMANGNHE
jgi:hypothetical protein